MTLHSPHAGPGFDRPLCPHLGVLELDQTPGPAIDYPSFENRCHAGERPTPILLTDQATLCLCAGFRQCPRFVAARAARAVQPTPAHVPQAAAAHPVPPAGDALSHALNELESEVKAGNAAERRSRSRWGWIGAGLIFMSSLLCGGVFAGYVGWQLVNRDLAMAPPGSVDTLAQGQPTAQPQVYLVVTATSEPAPAVAQAAQAGPAAPPVGEAALAGPAPAAEGQLAPQAYPAAVTATPAAGLPAFDPLAQLAPAQQPAPPAGAQMPQAGTIAEAAAPLVDVQLAIPTRRPTPVLDIPTSTPGAPGDAPTATATSSPTPVPPSGTPVVIFVARDTLLRPGECTNLMWHVENVRAVFLEDAGVDGKGEREVCVDNDPNDYRLTVVLPNGATAEYFVNVDVLLPTETPEPRPRPTEELEPTPTWTPPIPTATPTPSTLYGVRLTVDGGATVTCTPGSTCEANLFLSNTGSDLDTLTVYFTEAGAWPHQLCRMDGVCGPDRMSLVNMGPANTGVLRLSVSAPADAGPGRMVYRLQAASDGSGGAARSESVSVEVLIE